MQWATFEDICNSCLDDLQLYDISYRESGDILPLLEEDVNITPGSELEDDAPISIEYLSSWLDRFQDSKKRALLSNTFKEYVYTEALEPRGIGFSLAKEFSISIASGIERYGWVRERGKRKYSESKEDRLYFIRNGSKVYVTKKDLLDLLAEVTTNKEETLSKQTASKGWFSRLPCKLF